MTNNLNEVRCKYIGSVNEVEPINHRRYTFLENEEVSRLIVGLRFDSRNTDNSGNELIGQWALWDDKYTLYFHVNIKNDENIQCVAIRDLNIREELADKIKKLIKAESKFIKANEILQYSKVIVYFNSSLPYYNRVENWGNIDDYLKEKDLSHLKYKRKEIEVLKALLKPYINKKLVELHNGNFNIDYIDIISLENRDLVEVYEIEFNVVIDKDILFIGSARISDGEIDIINFDLHEK